MQLLAEKGICASPAKVELIVKLMKARVNFVHEIWDKSAFFFERPGVYDEASVKKFWKAETPAIMDELISLFESIPQFDARVVDEHLAAFINAKGYGMGAVMNALRLCILGISNGPNAADVCAIIGRDETIARLKQAIASV